MTENGADDVVEVVGNAAGEGPDGLHASRLLQARLQALLLAFEPGAPDRVADGVERHAKQRDLGPVGELATVHGIEAENAVAVAIGRDDAQPAAHVGFGEQVHGVVAM